MEEIKITFLGTGSAIPTKEHNHPAILASFANENILIDCGEGTQRQFKIAGLNYMKLTRIFITHWHGDHVLGLPGLFQTLALNGYNKILKVYGPKGTKRFIELIQELIRDFHIDLEVHEVSGRFLDESLFFAEAAEMHHGTPANAYSITLKDRIKLDKKKLKKFKLPNSSILGELASGKDIIFNKKKIKAKDVVYIDKGKKLTVVLDTSYNKNAIELAKNSEVLITEAEFSAEEIAKAQEYKHLTAPQTAEIAKKSKSKKLVLMHLSQRYEHNPRIIEKEAKKVFKNTILAKDFETLKI
jgi:ribonuclease Z